MEKYYIRFGNLPWDEKSFIYNEQGLIIGKREGVSVFDAVKVGDYYTPVMPNTEAGIQEYLKYTMYNKEEHLWRNMLLVIGDEIDRDEMNLPVIKNVKVVDVLPFDTIFPGRRDNSEL